MGSCSQLENRHCSCFVNSTVGDLKRAAVSKMHVPGRDSGGCTRMVRARGPCR